MYASTAIAVLPVIYEPEPAELGPPLLPDCSDELTGYVADAMGEGRRLFDVLTDPFVLERVDEYVSVLDHLAREPAVRATLMRQQRGEPTVAKTLAA
jgi:hypothetical protein